MKTTILIVIALLIAVTSFAQVSGPQTPVKVPTLEELNTAQQMDTLSYRNAALTMQLLERQIRDRQLLIDKAVKEAESKKVPAPAKSEPKK
jgi:hypothetical protein